MWKKDVSLDILKYSENQILVVLTESDSFQWVLTGFYGWLETQD